GHGEHSVRTISEGARPPARQLLRSPGRWGRPVQRPGAGQEEGLKPYAAHAWWSRFVCSMITGPLCERMLASASGSAVVQKAHSAEIRPMIQWVRPQP